MVVKTPAPNPILSEEVFPGQLRMDLQSLEGALQREILVAHQQAWDLALCTPFPSRKDEDWRWVDFDRFNPALWERHSSPDRGMTVAFKQGEQTYSGHDFGQGGLTNLRVAVENQPELVSSLLGTVVPDRTDKFAAIHSAMARDGFILDLPDGYLVDTPIEINLVVKTGSANAFWHSFVRLGKGAKATVILDLGSEDETEAYIGGILEVTLAEGAELTLISRQDVNPKSWVISHEKAILAAGARLDWFHAALGSKTTKTFLTVDLNGEGANAQLNGIYFGSDQQQINLDTQQNHFAPETISNLTYRGAANGEAHTTWEGMITVAPDAMKTDAYQSDRNLILGGTANMDAIPGLEICADDVRCSHGASVGRVNDEELFYLQCRGIPKDEARELIVNGFFADVIDTIGMETVRDELKQRILEKTRFKKEEEGRL